MSSNELYKRTKVPFTKFITGSRSIWLVGVEATRTQGHTNVRGLIWPFRTWQRERRSRQPKTTNVWFAMINTSYGDNVPWYGVRVTRQQRDYAPASPLSHLYRPQGLILKVTWLKFYHLGQITMVSSPGLHHQCLITRSHYQGLITNVSSPWFHHQCLITMVPSRCLITNASSPRSHHQ